MQLMLLQEISSPLSVYSNTILAHAPVHVLVAHIDCAYVLNVSDNGLEISCI